MRFREILVEYHRSKTAEKLGGSIAQRSENEHQLANLDSEQQVDRVLDRAESADPTPNKKYVLWIVRQFVKNGLKLEDINEFLRNDIQDFHELPKKRKQQLGIETDLNKYTWRDLREIAIKLKKATDLEEPVDAKLDYEHIDDMKVLYVGDMGQLIIPRTTEASCEIGSGTRWCTSATESENMFNYYSSKGTLYVWIPSRKMREKSVSNKFQFHFESTQFMDENDEQIESDLFRYFRNEHPVLKKLFAKGEEVIAQDPERAYQYALDVIKELEGKNRFPAGEEAIAQHPEWAYLYARYVIGGRFPEGEAVIAGHMGYAVEYALDVIKELEGENRFPAGEEVIAQDAEHAHFYAWKVIGGRFPKGEESIAQNPAYAYHYAREVIEGRFPEPHRAEAEANIKKDSKHWKAYVDFLKQSENQ